MLVFELTFFALKQSTGPAAGLVVGQVLAHTRERTNARAHEGRWMCAHTHVYTPQICVRVHISCKTRCHTYTDDLFHSSAGLSSPGDGVPFYIQRTRSVHNAYAATTL